MGQGKGRQGDEAGRVREGWMGHAALVGMALRNQSFVAVSGPAVTLTLRNAPAKDALMAIAQLGGYGFVYVGDGLAAAATAPASAAAPAAPAVPAKKGMAKYIPPFLKQ